jgi:hypothetical protein
VIGEGAGHNESAWAERFPEALQFLFGPVIQYLIADFAKSAKS